MKLNYLLNNIGPIEKADIELEDLTVIVGTNSIGKSLISKSAYISMKSLVSKDEEIVDLIKEEGYTPELYKYAENIFLRMSVKDMPSVQLDFNPLKINIIERDIKIKNVTYVDGPLIINESIPKDLGLEHNDDLKRKIINHKAVNNEFSEDPNKKHEILNLIDEIVENQNLEYSSEKRRFFLNVNDQIRVPINKAPNGIKTFLILRELLNNGYLDNESVLILDEPEILSHPVWQLSLAHIIGRIIKDLGLKVIVNTCSIYFIEALEMYSDSYKLKKNFYLGKKINGGYEFVKETNSIQNIYNALLDPFEKLDNLRMEYKKEE
jgi:hypothetical protein